MLINKENGVCVCVCVCVCVKSGKAKVLLSCVLRLLPHGLQPSSLLSVGVSRQEYWSGLPCPSPEDLPDPGFLHCRQILYQLESDLIQETSLPWHVVRRGPKQM